MPVSNQKFHREELYKFEVKLTESKGWGFFAKENIPYGEFVIEYMGEVIDDKEFGERFNKTKQKNYYFLGIGRNLFIDAENYGNDSRFINHSCDPNVALNKWIVYSNRHEHIRCGLFAIREIHAVSERRLLIIFYN